MIVPDSSAVALLFVDPATDPRAAAAREVLRADPVWVVPEHWHIEVISTVRGLWLGHKMDDERADRALVALSQATVAITKTMSLANRIWQLRSALTAYDAGYVATAEACSCRLVTADARIARSGAARCDVFVVA